MVNEERLEQYKRWFENYSFFGKSSFILDEIENLWNLINYLGNQYEVFCKYSVDDKQYEKLSEKKTIQLAQQFFDSHYIELNIQELKQNKILLIEKSKEKKTDDFFGTKKDGSSYYDNNHNKVISIVLENNFLDCMVLIHELMHYRNQPDDGRNFVSDLLTEVVSYGTELIYCEDLKESIYRENSFLHFQLLEKVLFQYLYEISYIYKIIYLYKKKRDITEDAYCSMFHDDKYSNTIEKFEEYASKKRSILRDTWMIFCIPLSIYVLEEYKKDKKFFEYLEEFSNKINEFSLWDCLKIIHIYDRKDFAEKIKQSTESFMDTLIDLYKMDEKKK